MRYSSTRNATIPFLHFQTIIDLGTHFFLLFNTEFIKILIAIVGLEGARK